MGMSVKWAGRMMNFAADWGLSWLEWRSTGSGRLEIAEADPDPDAEEGFVVTIFGFGFVFLFFKSRRILMGVQNGGK